MYGPYDSNSEVSNSSTFFHVGRKTMQATTDTKDLVFVTLLGISLGQSDSIPTCYFKHKNGNPAQKEKRSRPLLLPV